MEAKGLLQSEELYEYLLKTSVYPREAEFLKELRDATANHPRALMATAPDAGQLIALLLQLINANKTIEIGVFTGYSLLLTALSLPDDGKITAIDINREPYEGIGLPIIQKAGVEHKIDFFESPAIPVLDRLLENIKCQPDHALLVYLTAFDQLGGFPNLPILPENEGTFDFAFVDADKNNYLNYHEKLLKLLKIGGIVVYDNTLWGGTVAVSDESLVPEGMQFSRRHTIELNKSLAADSRVQISHVPVGDGITICRRLH